MVATSSVGTPLQRLRAENLRAAVVFSGGPAPGGNRVIGSCAKQFLDCGIPVIGIVDGYQYFDRLQPQYFQRGEHYLTLTRPLIQRLFDDPGLIIGTSRANPGKPITSPEYLDDPSKTMGIDRILDVFEHLRIGALVSLGGDDTLKTANFIYQRALRRLAEDPNRLFQGWVVHVPKTIDNDYYGIPWTFGFMTAAEEAGRQLNGLLHDAKATSVYHIAELMGRKAGWYTAGAAIYGRATKALIPEQFETPFDLALVTEPLLDVVLKRERQQQPYGVIAVAEGLADMLPEDPSVVVDSHGHKKLADIGIADQIAAALSSRYREERPEGLISFKTHKIGYSTRQIAPDFYDTLLTSQLGIGAFRLIADGHFGHMVTVKDGLDIDSIPFSELIDPVTLKVRNRNIDVNGDFYRMLRALEQQFGTAPILLGE